MPVLLFLLGLNVGSFVNVFVYRWPRELDWVRGRSGCTRCNYQLHWYDNVPIVSWLWLEGKCRKCEKPISWRYPIIETIHGGAWGVVGWLAVQNFEIMGVGNVGYVGGDLLRLVVVLLLFSTLLALVLIDWEYFLIPNELNWILVVLGILTLMANTGLWQERLLSSVLAVSFLGLIYLVTGGRGMGLGDVKMMAGMGLLLGYWVGMGLMMAFMIGSIIGGLLVLLQKAELRKPIPFGPFLVLGMLVTMVWGKPVWDWYWGMLL